ncbi:MAG: hypothetical protein WC359_15540 [Dehalococcoidia bacterium]|jgi:hypothetical protein
MADFTWSGVDARLYGEWKLSKPARVLLAHAIALCPNQYGIYDPSPYGPVIEWWDGILERDTIESAWQELTQRKIVIEFRNGECLWLVKKFKRYLNTIKTEKHRQGVVAFLLNYPEIKADFFDLYGIQITQRGIQIASGSNLDRIQTVYSEPEPEPEPKTNRRAPLGAPSSPPPSAPSSHGVDEQLADLESTLQPLSLAAWSRLKDAMHDARVRKRCATSHILAVLNEMLAETRGYHFTDYQIAYGFDSCRKAPGSIAENGRYFRKSAHNAPQEEPDSTPRYYESMTPEDYERQQREAGIEPAL